MDYLVKNKETNVLIEKQSKHLTDEIVDQLIAYRKKMKLTQQDVADVTGIKRANITRLESKKYEASLDSLMRYAGGLGLDIDFSLRTIRESCVKEKHTYGKLYEDIVKLQPEDTLNLLLEAQSEEEKSFYEMLGDFLLQTKQKQVVERNLIG